MSDVDCISTTMNRQDTHDYVKIANRKMMDKMINLMIARKKRKLTQKELAEKVGTTNIKISRFENGQDMPKADLLKRLAEELGVSMDYLLENTLH